jgi:drug/metabolite transporter (DMT)-like permease
MDRPPAAASVAGAGLWPAAALTLNAFVWGTSWWPFRQLEERGLHPLWATVMVFAAGTVVILVWRPRTFVQLARRPALWLLVLAAGATNAAFNWGVVVGDVVRVVLLFYLMPLWAVLLARWLLYEPLTRAALARVALALAGAALILWPQGAAAGSWPVPRELPDWLGLIGGFAFALNNVMLRREAAQPEAARALAMFAGAVLVAGGLAVGLGLSGHVPWPPAPSPGWMPGVLALGVAVLAGVAALQFGAARLRANVTAVVMLSEVLFAGVSAVALGSSVLTTQLLVGGGLIVLAAVLAALEPA